MYLLDTNVLSELRKPTRANPNVLAWAKASPAVNHYISAITILEIERGILLVERRDPLQGEILRRWFKQEVLHHFEKRILPIDAAVALRCAALHVPDPQPERDALIAATALTHGLIVVTRNIPDFQSTGVTLLDPWRPAEA
jgi:predicted nucleic acid-binding protein